MGKSSFDYRTTSATSGGSSSPWTATLAVGKNIFDYYDSRGSVTISGATEIDNVEDGPIVVARYNTLTLNAVLTTKYRCRGLVVLCDTLVAGASGGISMTGKGAKGSPAWPLYNLSIPTTVEVSAKYIRRKDYLYALRTNNWFIGDPVLAALGSPVTGDATATLTAGTQLLTASGCGAGGSGVPHAVAPTNQTDTAAGFGGVPGASAPGGGGGGGVTVTSGNYLTPAAGGNGGAGRPWSGGDAGQGVSTAGYVGSGGYAFGAYISAPGSILFVICRGVASLTAGHSFSAKSLDASGYYGSAGGGFVAFAAASVSGASPSLTAAAGAAGTLGGKGGDGATVVKTWAEMGWS